jgi:methionyl-tRNA formyltransferase
MSDDVDLVGVVTAPPRPAGRKLELRASPIGQEADGCVGVKTILTPDRLRDREAIDSVLALRPDIAILADYGQLVPAPILDLPLGALNLHPSLLPRHRGATPIPATILAGDKETGVTLIQMDRGLDTGPIVAQARVPLRGSETTPELQEILEARADSLLQASLGPWIRGELKAVPQDESGATLTGRLTRDDGRLGPDIPALQAWRMVRAYLPWPGTFIETPSGRLVVLAGSVADSAPGDVPGRLVAEGDGLALATTAGRLRLERVQPAGGRPMSGGAFLRGRGRDLVGRSLV